MNTSINNSVFAVRKLALTAALALTGTALCVNTSMADDASATVPTQVVSFSDLDLSRSDGAATLYGRIKSAAHQVCASQNGRDLRAMSAWQACVDQAIARAVQSVNQPTLTRYYLAKVGKPASPMIVTADR